jgi:ABC-type uncharacterized transport system substrate-binding protein
MLWVRRILAAYGVAASLLLGATPAAAHPHVWIDAFVEVLFTDDKITGLRINWTFDPFFTGMATADFDANQDGVLDPQEASTLAALSAENLKESGFFSKVWLDGDPLTIEAVDDFRVWLADDRLHYAFVVAMPSPVDPITTSLDISLYDPTFYVEITPDVIDPLRVKGSRPPCLINVQPDPQRTIYFGLVRPTLMQLLCTGA